jgi:hypothetical protein
MKKITAIILVLFIALVFVACENSQSKKTPKTDTELYKAGTVEVYYFHGTRRCVTCISVGDVSSKFVKTNYSNNPKVKFIEVNIDEDAPGVEELAKKFMVTGSGLYVYNGTEIENITAYAFQNAISSPEKLENKLTELINKNL